MFRLRDKLNEGPVRVSSSQSIVYHSNGWTRPKADPQHSPIEGPGRHLD
ncbi:protein of unknown function [uncultured Woeseiaceae bacterium]|uniref:Uncharacterized protein n=1 Tax=uncultured Woeseiaceae bacterium TaxID=1983305 RepID=A0A7D9D4X6_9GAMM|nr:protein of unknown function [uncultured Woeseiaceae bacterium]VUX56097.1 protein of unknown function [uncultured Woeseiaceae bacterium]